MNRADGYKLSGCDPLYEIIPHIMDHRYDASNHMDLDLDTETIQHYINECRQKGIRMAHMSVIIAAYLRTVAKYPYLNRFVVNKKIFARNHFCVSFVTLKEGENEETVVKLYFNLDDDIFEVNRKVNEAIEINRKAQTSNSMDKLLRNVMKIPFLVRGVVSVLKWWDKHFTLPFAVLDGSPFHTSLFITNLASIRLNAIYHHIYEFGTTSIFIAMGQQKKQVCKVGCSFEEKKFLPMKVVADERIASGYYYARCFREFKKYLDHPELLEVKAESIEKDPNIKAKNPKFIVK